MPLIKILPVEIRNKIAAGEVIERPASVVKELVENSLDAGGTDIRIEVLHGGKGIIKVCDNGTGMDRDDAFLSLQPHATSKLKSEAALFDIRTMGFRGEALPSIASVSRLRLITGMKDAEAGISIEMQGGEVKETRECPSIGTTVEVRELFFNTPARKKFLKSDNTELFHIIDTVTKEALSNWEISFKLFAENQETLTLPASYDIRERLAQIYGLEFTEGLSTAASEDGGMAMTAFVSKSDNFRNSRTHQFIFINRRPIRDSLLSNAVYKAYEGILPQDKHPIFFLYLDMDPARVDFNVHPAKREVRFEEKEKVYRFVLANLREAVRKERLEFTMPFAGHSGHVSGPVCQDYNGSFSAYTRHTPSDAAVSENIELSYRANLPFIYLGDTFIAVSGKGGLTIVDHHAAHERILYESLLNGLKLNSCRLLFPAQVKLSHKEYRVILEHRHLLYEMGMEADDFGSDTVIVRSLPEALKEADMRGILSDVAAALMEGTMPDKAAKEAVSARIACHGSVRGKEILNQEEVSGLLSDLEKTEHPDQCPHGRPTRIFFSPDDLKKMFKRK